MNFTIGHIKNSRMPMMSPKLWQLRVLLLCNSEFLSTNYGCPTSNPITKYLTEIITEKILSPYKKSQHWLLQKNGRPNLDVSSLCNSYASSHMCGSNLPLRKSSSLPLLLEVTLHPSWRLSRPLEIELTSSFTKSNCYASVIAQSLHCFCADHLCHLLLPLWIWETSSGLLSLPLTISTSIYGSPTTVTALRKSIYQGNQTACLSSPTAHQLLLIILCWVSNDKY